NESQQQSSHSGTGTYSSDHESPSGETTWGAWGETSEGGANFSSEKVATESTYSSGQWSTTGQGEAKTVVSNYSSYNGSGYHVQELTNKDESYSGMAWGDRNEKGSTSEFKASLRISMLDATGTWHHAGSASGKSHDEN